MENLSALKTLQSDLNRRAEDSSHGDADDQGEDPDLEVDLQGDIVRRPSVRPEEFWTELAKKCQEVGGEWVDVVDRIWAFGPQGAGGCFLVDSRKGIKPHS